MPWQADYEPDVDSLHINITPTKISATINFSTEVSCLNGRSKFNSKTIILGDQSTIKLPQSNKLEITSIESIVHRYNLITSENELKNSDQLDSMKNLTLLSLSEGKLEMLDDNFDIKSTISLENLETLKFCNKSCKLTTKTGETNEFYYQEPKSPPQSPKRNFSMIDLTTTESDCFANENFANWDLAQIFITTSLEQNPAMEVNVIREANMFELDGISYFVDDEVPPTKITKNESEQKSTPISTPISTPMRARKNPGNDLNLDISENEIFTEVSDFLTSRHQILYAGDKIQVYNYLMEIIDDVKDVHPGFNFSDAVEELKKTKYVKNDEVTSHILSTIYEKYDKVISEPEQTDYTCILCCEEIRPPRISLSRSKPFKPLSAHGCNHYICKDCFADYIDDDKKDETQQNQPVLKCFIPDCQKIFDARLVCSEQKTTDKKEKQKANFTSYFTSACIGTDCKVVHKTIPESDIPEKDQFPQGIFCKDCDIEYCLNCKNEYHSPLYCSELEIWNKWKVKIGKEDLNELKTKKYLIAESKPCPKCGVSIQKRDGCNYIMCSIKSCKHEFCWLCLRPCPKHRHEAPGCMKEWLWQNQKNEKGHTSSKELDDLEAEINKFKKIYARYEAYDRSLQHELEMYKKVVKSARDGVFNQADLCKTDAAAVLQASRNLVRTRLFFKWSVPKIYVLNSNLYDKQATSLALFNLIDIYEIISPQMEVLSKKIQEILESEDVVGILRKNKADVIHMGEMIIEKCKNMVDFF